MVNFLTFNVLKFYLCLADHTIEILISRRNKGASSTVKCQSLLLIKLKPMPAGTKQTRQITEQTLFCLQSVANLPVRNYSFRVTAAQDFL